jgi:hypothetical protein
LPPPFKDIEVLFILSSRRHAIIIEAIMLPLRPISKRMVLVTFIAPAIAEQVTDAGQASG